MAHEKKNRGCVNGLCTAPNYCSCREGFEINKTGTRCDAKCEKPCLNGNAFLPQIGISNVFLNIFFQYYV